MSGPYNAYKEVWEAAVGESLVCEKEPENASDRYAVAVRKELSTTFASKGTVGVFAVLATRRYYRMCSKIRCKKKS